MEQEEYMQKRVDDQIRWYDKKSKTCQLRFKTLRFIEVICACLIPLFAGFEIFGDKNRLIAALLGSVIAVCAALAGLGNYQENWIDYRATCESLRHEKYFFLTGSDPFDCPDSFKLFVQRVEGLVSKENATWSQRIRVVGKKERV